MLVCHCSSFLRFLHQGQYSDGKRASKAFSEDSDVMLIEGAIPKGHRPVVRKKKPSKPPPLKKQRNEL